MKGGSSKYKKAASKGERLNWTPIKEARKEKVNFSVNKKGETLLLVLRMGMLQKKKQGVKFLFHDFRL